jgi:hypothetical protein
MTRPREPGDTENNPLAMTLEDLLPIQRVLLDELNRVVPVRKDGHQQEMSLEQAVIQKLIQAGLAGSPHALGQILRYSQRAQRVEAVRIAADIARGYKIEAFYKQKLEKWTKDGKDPILFIPHPDDIVVTEGVGCKIKGPADEKELKATLEQRDLRDLFIAQAYLEQRLATRKECAVAESDARLQPDASAWVIAFFLDGYLPKRFQLDRLAELKADRKYRRMTKRELLTHLFKAWRKIGKPVPRGTRLPPFDRIEKFLNGFAKLWTEMRTRVRTSQPMAESEIAEYLTELMAP